MIPDVVYNHKAEGNEKGPPLFFQGHRQRQLLPPAAGSAALSDQRYGDRQHAQREPRPRHADGDGYPAATGWSRSTAGFRFDLDTSSRASNGFDNQSGFLKACCSQDPTLRTVKLIAESWDCGPGATRSVRSRPAGASGMTSFAIRCRYWRSETSAAVLAPRLCAWGDGFDDQGCRPWSSVNFITAHDGFPLNDLVTCNDEHNEVNGEKQPGRVIAQPVLERWDRGAHER